MSTAETAGAVETALDIQAIQAALQDEQLSGWLLYDFHGINPIATDVTGLNRRGGHLATRRWFYLIPASGEPRALVHGIERTSLAHLPGSCSYYAGREQLRSGLETLLSGVRRVAMEYSPGCAIPYIARVDAGTVELVRDCGVEVASSGDLVQRFSAVWDARQITTHRTASEKLYRVKDRALEAIGRRTRDGQSTSEYDIQQLMAGWFVEEGLISDSAPMVSAAENAGNPHYMPTAASSRSIKANELVLLDLWAKVQQPGAVFADITWMSYSGSRVPQRFAGAFTAVMNARDAAVALVQQATRANQDIRGWEVDRAASQVLHDAGYGAGIMHRTGHSLGESVHGNGVNMDDYETHDDRRLLPGTGFTIEPGVYYADFGIRSEINVVVGHRDAVVAGPAQQEITALG